VLGLNVLLVMSLTS